MFPILHVGPLAIQVPGLILLIGIWLGLSLAEKSAPQRGIPSNTLYNLVFFALIAGIIGARLSYVIRYPNIFIDNPASVVSLNPGLLDLWGGAVTAFIVILIYAQRKKLALWPTLDALTPFLGMMAVAIGFAHAASGAAFGIETDLPWAIELWGAQRHPSQIYESLAAVIILIIMWPKRSIWKTVQPGIYFLTFFALSAAAHLFLEAFRGDSELVLGGFRSAQVIAWAALAFSMWGIYRLQNRDRTAGG